MISMLPTSVVGVRTAAHTTHPTIACLKHLTSIVAVTSPIRLNTKITARIWNTMPSATMMLKKGQNIQLRR